MEYRQNEMKFADELETQKAEMEKQQDDMNAIKDGQIED